MIYVSTGGFRGLTAYHASLQLINNDITKIELSGGLYDEFYLDHLKSLATTASFHIHNYFPPPVDPFVLNLASLNAKISDLSMQHVSSCLSLSDELNTRYYSIHAGFLVDPLPSSLGSTLEKMPVNKREIALETFISRLNILSELAYMHNCIILIENNVLTSSNLKKLGVNPLLMTETSETEHIMQSTPENIQLLVDVAHLKVSSSTLGYDPVNNLCKTSQWIAAYHLSDNDGTCDSNEEITPSSWFWPHIQKDVAYHSLEVYTDNLTLLKDQVSLAQALLQ